MALQEYGLEYTITGRLGGTVRSPQFSLDPSSPLFVPPDADGLRRFTVEELGVLDLPLAPGSTSIGTRFLKTLWLLPPAQAAGFQGRVDIVDSETLEFFRLVGVANAGARRIYQRWANIVPQGGSLRFTGPWEASASSAIRLRVAVRPADTVEQWAKAAFAKCFCSLVTQGPGGGDTPPPTETCPTIDSVTPSVLSLSTPAPQQLVIDGSNFVFNDCTGLPPLRIGVFPNGGGPPLPEAAPPVITDSQITLSLDVGIGGAPVAPGSYDVAVSCLNDPACGDLLANALDIAD